MKIITVSATHCSFKFTLWNMENEMILCTGVVERIGLDASRYVIRYEKEQIIEEVEMLDYSVAVHTLLDKLVTLNILEDVTDISAVGHKILFGKDFFEEKVFLSEEILSQLDEFAFIESMADTLNVIRAFHTELPEVDMVGVFDTAFYCDLPEEAYLYGVPYRWYSEYGVRKYGFQGICHRFLTKEASQLLGKDDLKLISCYLDNEGSISAICNGKCIDTSMGFTPLTGIMMSTKCGDIDPSIIPYVMEKEGKNVGEVLDDLMTSSGLLGLSECSSDMRDILTLCSQNHPKANLTKNKYVRKVVDYIAQYYVLLQEIDAIVLSGFIGENSVAVRREICEKLYPLGVKIDLDQNSICGELVKISTEDSKIPVYVIPCQESLMIARSTLELENR